MVLSLALIGFIWQLIYSRDQGLLNAVLGTQIDWYGDSNVNLWAVLVAAGWKHAGYIMLLYLAGLKGVDPSLREAAAVDGASQVRAFFSVVFPVMRPINIIILVVTVIEALRAFDIVWVINKGTNGLELIANAGHRQRHRRGEPDRLRLGPGHHHAGDLAGVHHHLPVHRHAGGATMSSATVTRTPATTGATAAKARRRRLTVGRVVLYVFVVATALAWLFPVVWALLNSFRDYDYTSVHGYVSLGGFTFQNYLNAWEQGEFTRHFLNSLYHHRARGAVDAVPRLLRGLRGGPLQLPVQPGPARAVHRGQPAAPAGAADPAVPCLPRDPAAAVDERLGPAAGQLLGADPGQRGLPDRASAPSCSATT